MKKFILERNLLYPNPSENDLTPEEKAICRKYDVFMRFLTKEKHDELLRTVISEHWYMKRIQEIKVWDMDAIILLWTFTFFSLLGKLKSFPTFVEHGRKKQLLKHIYIWQIREEMKLKEVLAGWEKVLMWSRTANNHGFLNALMSPDSACTRPAGPATSSVVEETGYSAANLLSEVVRIFFFCHVFILKLYIASNFVFETVGCNFLSGENFVLRVKVVSNRVSEDARGHVWG